MPVMLGQSQAFELVRSQLCRYASCNVPVLIEGETGTGKELAAREIHYASARSAGPFLPVNRNAIPAHLLENKLFGHDRGGFTDTTWAQHGRGGHACGSTLFPDEVEALSTKGREGWSCKIGQHGAWLESRRQTLVATGSTVQTSRSTSNTGRR